MPIFKYEGINKAGEKVTQEIEAENESTLRTNLRSRSVRPTQITLVSHKTKTDTKYNTGQFSTVHVPIATLAGFTRQLQVLLSSGVPLIQSFEMLVGQTSQTNFKALLMEVQTKVSQGSHLWETLSNYPNVFPKIYSSLIHAGETSGSLDQMLKRLARYLEDSDRIRKTAKSAMMYPVIIFAVALLVITGMLVFVIPQFESMIKGSGQDLPLPTQLVISASKFFTENILYITGSIGISIYLLTQYLRTSVGKIFLDHLMFQLPLFGPIMKKSGISQFSRTLQILLTSGMNLLDALDICIDTIDNCVLELSFKHMKKEIEKGKSISSVLNQIDVFPKMAAQMIGVGEATGHLSEMLEKIADTFDMEVELMVAGLSKLIEPLILVFVGTMVGGMLIAMYLPIFKLAGSA